MQSGPEREPPQVRAEELLEETAWLERLALSLVRDADLADDLVQDTWLAWIRTPPRAGVPLRPWVVHVMRNLVRRLANKPRMSSAEGDVPAAPAATEGHAEMAGLVVQLVDGLQEPYRSTVVMRYFDDLDATQISKIVGVAPGTVRWRLKQALDEIRAKLDQSHRGDRRAWCLAMAPLLRKEIEAARSAASSAAVKASFGAGTAIVLAALVGAPLAFFLWRAEGSQQGSDAARTASLAVGARDLDSEPTAFHVPADASGRAPAPGVTAETPVEPAPDPPGHGAGPSVGAVVWGRVTRSDGAVVAGARVFVRQDTGFSFGEIERTPNGPVTSFHVLESTATNQDGEFRVTGLPDQQYVRVFARSEDSGWGWSRACLVRADARLGPVQVELPNRPAGAGLELEVVDAFGGPADDVAFLYRESSPFYRVGHVADGRGYLNDGSLLRSLLVFDTRGVQGYAHVTDIPSRERLVVELAPQPWIEFQLHDQQEQPVRDVRITLKYEVHGGPVLGRVDSSERPGEPLRVGGVPGHPLVYDIEAPGYLRVMSDPLVMTEENQTIRGVLEREPAWFGSVLADGRPVENADVQFHVALPQPILYRSLRGFPLRAAMMASMTATTDGDGRFGLSLGAGTARVFARYRAPGYAWHMVGPLTLARGETLQETPFELERSGRIHGRVTTTRDGLTLPGTIVGLTNGGPDYRETVAGEDGVFAFEDVAPGDWYLFPKEREVEHDFAEAMETLSFPPDWAYPSNCTVLAGGEAYLELNVDRMQGGRVDGELSIAHGSPAGWNVVLRSGIDDPFRATHIVRESIGADGLFDVETPDSGSYLFHFEPPSDPAAGFVLLRPIEVGAQTTKVDAAWSLGVFELEVAPGFAAPPGAFLYGVIRTADGFQGVFTILPDADGRQTLELVPAGEGRIAFMRPGDAKSDPWSWSGVLAEFGVAAGETTVVVLE